MIKSYLLVLSTPFVLKWNIFIIFRYLYFGKILVNRKTFSINWKTQRQPRPKELKCFTKSQLLNILQNLKRNPLSFSQSPPLSLSLKNCRHWSSANVVVAPVPSLLTLLQFTFKSHHCHCFVALIPWVESFLLSWFHFFFSFFSFHFFDFALRSGWWLTATQVVLEVVVWWCCGSADGSVSLTMVLDLLGYLDFFFSIFCKFGFLFFIIFYYYLADLGFLSQFEFEFDSWLYFLLKFENFNSGWLKFWV